MCTSETQSVQDFIVLGIGIYAKQESIISMEILKFQAILFRISALLIILGTAGCASKPNVEIHDEFGKYYEDNGVVGSFALLDEKNNRYVLFNPQQFDRPFLPASTFKICNSLIGLETNVIPDEHFVLPWDSVVREVESWNHDQDMKTAFRNSTVWYYQELARRVGGKKMKYWLDRAGYGNGDTTGGCDQFWLTGGLRISPEQQIAFLKKLHDDDLPFSKRNMEIVRQIMVVKEFPGLVFRAKTGWGNQDRQHIGWYVGYLETADNLYYFSNCIQSADTSPEKFGTARKEIVYKILSDLKLISGNEFAIEQ